MLMILLAAHVLSAVFWVGGMAFAYMVLRPAVGALDAPQRLGLWRRVFATFLPWAGVAALILIASGYMMMFAIYKTASNAPGYIHMMEGLGLVMLVIYLYLVMRPWQRFKKAVDSGATADAAAGLATIRKIVAVNLAIGVLVIIVATAGRFW
ncbi:putative integral membrane protein [Hoeflea sp. IMCC20628]|uniref:CopD family protein n=1 Tax=Hoeflea sp. IMCC20628 TaxID=1620421 RepID=UPI00063BE468|nr:CopD family protein [Hoeflea sp. IMCC20628]AKI01491.1 putative integral membrane protein [Hoeflea sp. IMCC20628]